MNSHNLSKIFKQLREQLKTLNPNEEGYFTVIGFYYTQLDNLLTSSKQISDLVFESFMLGKLIQRSWDKPLY